MRNTLFSLMTLLLLAGAGRVNATVKSWQKESDGVSFSLDVGVMKIRVCTPDIIEVQYSIQPHIQQRLSLVVNNRFASGGTFTVSEVGGAVVIVTSRLHVSIDKSTNAVSYTDLSGRVVLAEDARNNKWMDRQVLATSVSNFLCSTQIEMPSDEGLFGLG